MVPSLALLLSAVVLAPPLQLGPPGTRAHPADPAGHPAMPRVAPESVGMSAERLAVIDRVMDHALAAGGFPGAAVIVGRHGAIVWERGYGTLGGGSRAAADPERTLYDLASLTKVVGTTTAIMILFDEGKIHLDDSVVKFIPEFSGGDKDAVTIRQLLEHRSGLPAGRDLWRIAHSPEEARAAVIATPLIARPGAQYEYSDLGADMLGFVVD